MKKLSIACLALTVSLPIFAYESGPDISGGTMIIVSIFQIILFFKLWGATNDIEKIKNKLEIKVFDESELRVLYMTGHKDEAIAYLNRWLATEVQAAFKEATGKRKFEQRFKDAYDKAINKYKPMYDALGEEVPESITSITSYEQYKKFGKK